MKEYPAAYPNESAYVQWFPPWVLRDLSVSNFGPGAKDLSVSKFGLGANPGLSRQKSTPQFNHSLEQG
jgi:hypothetical protein